MLEFLRELVFDTKEDSELLDRLSPICQQLQQHAEMADCEPQWPAQSIRILADGGVFRWFVPAKFGGEGWSEKEILIGYLALSQACLTTTFILTQWNAACKRLLTSDRASLQERYGQRLASGELFVTVGISHLSTSRQHLAQPAIQAVPQEARAGQAAWFSLTGSSPWVTGGMAADLLALGATLPNGEQILVAVDGNREGIAKHPGNPLLALSGSCTARVDLHAVRVELDDVIAGPHPDILQLSSSKGSGTGGLQTSTLALGLALAAIDFLSQEAKQRPEIETISEKFRRDAGYLVGQLLLFDSGEAQLSLVELRQQANSLVMRATQAALQTAKGAGFVKGHPAGRWATQALFFLVWSCPQSVVEASLCTLAGLE